jgi:hypothetical protein
MRAVNGSWVPFHLPRKEEKEVWTSVNNCNRKWRHHARSMQGPTSQEYPKRILGKSDVYQMYDSVHKKESPIIMSHQQKRKTLPSFSDLVLEPEVW